MSAEDVQLGAAERGEFDFDDDVGRVADGGDGSVFEGDVVRRFEDDRFHCGGHGAWRTREEC